MKNFILFFFLHFSILGFGQPYYNAFSLSGLGNENIIEVVSHNTQYTFLLCEFSGSISDGTTTINSSGGQDGILIKVDNNTHQIISFLHFKSTNDLNLKDLDLATLGSSSYILAMCGSFSGALDITDGVNSFSLSSSGNTDGFVVSLQSSGQFIVKSIGGTGNDGINEVSLEPFVSIWLIDFTGYFENSVSADGLTVVSNGGKDILIGQLDLLVNSLYYLKSFGGNQDDIGVKTQSLDHLPFTESCEIVLGEFESNVVNIQTSNGTANISNIGGKDIIMIIYNTFGGNFTVTDVNSLGGSNNEYIGDISMSVDNMSQYSTVQVSTLINSESNNINNFSSNNVTIFGTSTHNASLLEILTFNINSPGTNYPIVNEHPELLRNSLTDIKGTSLMGNMEYPYNFCPTQSLMTEMVLLSGIYDGQITLGSNNYISSAYDIFWAGYDFTNYTFKCSNSIGNTANNMQSHLGMAYDRNCFISGDFSSSINIGSNNLVSSNAFDGFWAEIFCCLNNSTFSNEIVIQNQSINQIIDHLHSNTDDLIVGNFSGTITKGTSSLSTYTGSLHSAFLIGVTQNKTINIKIEPDNSNDVIEILGITQSGQFLYALTKFIGSYTLNSTTYTSTNNPSGIQDYDFLIIAVDLNSNSIIDAFQLTGSAVAHQGNLVAYNGSVFLAGDFANGDIVVGSSTYTNNSNDDDMFIAKISLNSNGLFIGTVFFSEQISTPGTDDFYDLIEYNGIVSILCTSSFGSASTLSFQDNASNTITLNRIGDQNLILLSFDINTMNNFYAVNIGAGITDRFYWPVFEKDPINNNDIYICTNFLKNSFGSPSISSNNGFSVTSSSSKTQMLMFKMSNSGAISWMKSKTISSGGIVNFSPKKLVITNSEIGLFGWTSSSFSFDNVSITQNTGNYDMFFLRMNKLNASGICGVCISSGNGESCGGLTAYNNEYKVSGFYYDYINLNSNYNTYSANSFITNINCCGN